MLINSFLLRENHVYEFVYGIIQAQRILKDPIETDKIDIRVQTGVLRRTRTNKLLFCL